MSHLNVHHIKRGKITENIGDTEIYGILFSSFIDKSRNFAVLLPNGIIPFICLPRMVLHDLSIINYRNIAGAVLRFSPKLNCFIGHNGAGKTNVLDAVYYLSFCRSSFNPIDSQLIKHDADFFMLDGNYLTDQEEPLNVYAGLKKGSKKHFKKDKKEYRRLSEHLGIIPMVMVAPSDTLLIDGGSEERRKLMDIVIAQYDRNYIEALNQYNRVLQQRNAMLKEEQEPDEELMGVLEMQMADAGEHIFQCRTAFVEELIPLFQHYYEAISSNREEVGISYLSHCQRGPLLQVIQRDRFKDRAVGYSLHGVHRDDLVFTIAGHPMKREGSQGQNKSFVIALKLAQFDFLRRTGNRCVPILLLDDIFDKLDAERVEQIVRLVSGKDFGQIFITDTNKEHLDRILSQCSYDYKIFHVSGGVITEDEQEKM